MPRVDTNLCAPIRAGQPLYRITSNAFLTRDSTLHRQVVNGEGALHSPLGGRYNFPGAQTVYLADAPATCFAERLFYLQREIIAGIDRAHIMPHGVPPFTQPCVLWTVTLAVDMPSVFDLDAHGSFYQVFPSLSLSPSQDYEHLKAKRAEIQAHGYQGLSARSTRSRDGGRILAMFGDLSPLVASIEPTPPEVRLVTRDLPRRPFVNHAVDRLDFNTGEVRALDSMVWETIEFNR
ncbi:MAG: RES family NAD+ phosphorylase [Deltaproteobacteria bacterium]|nr:RES family NAD+ phosphorylase [Deltaproteobacteria bacterium]